MQQKAWIFILKFLMLLIEHFKLIIAIDLSWWESNKFLHAFRFNMKKNSSKYNSCYKSGLWIKCEFCNLKYNLNYDNNKN